MMITINVNPGLLTITGHAGAGPPGHDIVCAAVSVLLQTLVASIEELTDDEIEYDINPGNARLEYEHLSEKSRTLMGAFFIGISGVAEGYPECITIIDKTIVSTWVYFFIFTNLLMSRGQWCIISLSAAYFRERGKHPSKRQVLSSKKVRAHPFEQLPWTLLIQLAQPRHPYVTQEVSLSAAAFLP